MLILIDQFDPDMLATGQARFERLTPQHAVELLTSTPTATSASAGASQELGIDLLNYLGDSIRLNQGNRAVFRSNGRWYLATAI